MRPMQCAARTRCEKCKRGVVKMATRLTAVRELCKRRVVKGGIRLTAVTDDGMTTLSSSAFPLLSFGSLAAAAPGVRAAAATALNTSHALRAIMARADGLVGGHSV